MDPFKQLEMEYDFIESAIRSYSDSSAASKILPSLKQGMEHKDKDVIEYCLSVISDWYTDTIPEMKENPYVDNWNEHYRAYDLVQELGNRMVDYQFIEESGRDQVAKSLTTRKPMIFLSHCSLDKAFGDVIVSFLRALGVPNDCIVYTSHPLHKIPVGANIYDYLRCHINNNVHMVILWSNAYLDSPACMNEMGAGWVVQCDYTNMYVPDFSFGNPKYHECAVDSHKMGIVLNGDAHCKQSLIEFKNKIQELFNLSNDESASAYYIDNCIDELKALKGGTNG